MSKYAGSKMKLFPSEKEVNSFFQSGEVEQVIGLYMKRNESFVLFYIETSPIKEETEELKISKKGKKP
jgi:hypothetical protein